MISTRPLLQKKERLNSQKAIETLFESGSRSLSSYPIRAVYRTVTAQDVPVSLLISVSKRHFKHAVDRNRIKRQLREAFRKNKNILWQIIEAEKDTDIPKVEAIHLALIWTSNTMLDSKIVEDKVRNLLLRITERL